MWSSLASIERFLDSLLGKNRGDLVLCVCWTSPVEILFDALESVLCYTVISDCFIQANCYGFSCAENECKKGRMEFLMQVDWFVKRKLQELVLSVEFQCTESHVVRRGGHIKTRTSDSLSRTRATALNFLCLSTGSWTLTLIFLGSHRQV